MVKEIHFFTGKGGVGKSIVALAMAQKKAKSGQRVLLVELGDQSFYKDLLDLPEVSYKPMRLKDNLDLSLWTGTDCLKEYALHLLKIQSLYKLFFENPISRSLIEVAPSLPEIAIMGKITSGPRNHGPQMHYDVLVVDAYATGHFLSLLKAPFAMSQAIQFGPMGEQNRRIDEVLRNPDLCHYHLVTLPEELPIKETEELFFEIKDFLKIKPDIRINKMIETTLTAKELTHIVKENPSLCDLAKYIAAALERQKDAKDRLAELKTKIVELPLVTELNPWKTTELLAERLNL